jgi:isopentenyldiphosphate isomerase
MPDPEEMFPIVDEDGNEISIAPRSVCHDGKSMLLHPVVHFHLLNPRRELFLQKRAMTKDLFPGRWDTSVGGHTAPGEDIETALRRETKEELGLVDIEFQFNKKYIWQSPRERELVYSFTGSSNDNPVINSEEINEGKFWKMDEIKRNLGNNIFTPNFEFEFKMLFIKCPDTQKGRV